MKKYFYFVLTVFLIVSMSAPALFAQDTGAIGVILNNFGARNYAAGAITKADLDKIIQAGIRAPSAGNRQPWKFIVVQNSALQNKIISGAGGNGGSSNGAIVVVSARADSTNTQAALDCALATESIYLAAQALGYGSRIYTGPVAAVNRDLKKELGLSDAENVFTIIRIGRLPAGVDAVSSASPRKSAADIVEWK